MTRISTKLRTATHGISLPVYTGFGDATPSGIAQANDNGSMTLGTRFHVDRSGLSVRAIRFYMPSGTQGTPASTGYIGALFQSTADGAGSIITQSNFSSTLIVDGWNRIPITPQGATMGVDYYAGVYFPTGVYGAIWLTFASIRDASPIIFPRSTPETKNGTYAYASGIQSPTGESSAAWYGVDVEVS